LRIATSRKSCGELLPQCTLAPAAEPIEHRGSGNIFGGQRTPAQALAKAMQSAADGPAIIHPWLTPKYGRSGSIVAHCASFSQNSAAIIQALLDSLNEIDRSRRNGHTP
jgi:hypothetical protein